MVGSHFQSVPRTLCREDTCSSKPRHWASSFYDYSRTYQKRAKYIKIVMTRAHCPGEEFKILIFERLGLFACSHAEQSRIQGGTGANL